MAKANREPLCTPEEIIAALAAQRLERAAVTRATGIRFDPDGRIMHLLSPEDPPCEKS